MLTINQASDLLRSGESAIVLFTRDRRLVNFSADGSGSSGDWVTNPDYHDRPDKVIIYNRLSKRVPMQSEVYVADFVDIVEAKTRGRFIVHFRNQTLSGKLLVMGTTHSNWYEFAETGPNPVRYLSKR